MFDVSHMGQLRISGKDRYKFINKIQTGDIEKLEFNKSQLALMLNDQAGIIDDTIVSHFPDYIGMVVNSGNKFSDLIHMFNIKMLHKFEVDIVHLQELSLIAIQGPSSHQVLQSIIHPDVDLTKVKFMDSILTQTHSKYDSIPIQVSRSGYTGEDGFELGVEDQYAEKLANILLENEQVELAGLGARDTLRLEAGLCLHGHEMDLHINPVQAQLMWTVRKNYRQQMDADSKKDTAFIGARLLAHIQDSKSANHKRVGLVVLDKGIIRQDCEIFDDQKSK